MTARLRPDLKFSLIDGLTFSLMVGLGESFITAYVLARGHSEFAASLMSTAPLFIGAILQLSSPLGIRKLGSYRQWVLLVATAQAISLICLSATSWFHSNYFLIFTIAALYWGAGLAAGPAWNAWVAEIIPAKLRTGFFSRRTRWCHLFTFLGLLAGGFFLHFAKDHDFELMGFGLIFLSAAFFRFASVWALSRQTKPKSNATLVAPTFFEMQATFFRSPLKKFMIFILLFQTATYVSASLSTPFMLREMGVDYATYMALLASSLISRFVSLAYARPLIERMGLKKVFVISLFLITPIPVLWTLKRSLPLLFALQALSGLGWGFFELVIFLIMFNDLPNRDRAPLLTYYNLLQTTGIVAGSLAGGWWFQSLGGGWNAYHDVFIGSTVLRLCTWIALPGLRIALPKIRIWIYLRPFSVRAHTGLLSRPLYVRLPLPRRRKQNIEKPLPETGQPR